MNSRFLASLFLVFSLTACTTVLDTPPRDSVEHTDAATVSLAQAAVSVSQTLGELGEATRADTPDEKRLVNASRYLLPGTASIDWNGPVEPLLTKVIKGSGYRLRVIGSEPAIPVLVSLNVKNSRLTDVLRDLDFQIGKKADIRVVSGKHTVELRYHKA